MGKGRAPCCDKSKVKKGPWSPAEDLKLITFIQKHGHGNWRALPKQAGLLRCGKSCRLRWINYLRPDLKRGNFTPEEEQIIFNLHDSMGNKWSKIASHLPGRTDNEIKNVWNTHLKKRLAIKNNSTTEKFILDQNDDSNSISSCGDQNSENNYQEILRSSKGCGSPTATSSSSSSSQVGEKIEIPVLDSNDMVDIWEFLDYSLFDDHVSTQQFGANDHPADHNLGEEVEYLKWLSYMENDIEENKADGEMILEPTPGISLMDCFSIWPSSPQNF